jgi:membrane protein DedA with SNARE-associated domain
MLNEIVNFLIATIYQNLFLGIFLGVFLETIFPPIPSEIILPLSGYLISFYNFSLLGLLIGILIATIGTTIGSLLYHFAALKLGRKFAEKYGKYFFIDKRKLRAAENWFKKHGRKAVFFGRMLPGIRELISLPAGFFKNETQRLFNLHFLWFFYLVFILNFSWIFSWRELENLTARKILRPNFLHNNTCNNHLLHFQEDC